MIQALGQSFAIRLFLLTYCHQVLHSSAIAEEGKTEFNVTTASHLKRADKSIEQIMSDHDKDKADSENQDQVDLEKQQQGQGDNSTSHENDDHNNKTAIIARNKSTTHQKKHVLPILDWITQNFDWSWFTATQSTGGIATTLSLCPKPFRGIQTIGTTIFIFNIILFLLFATFLLIRWIRRPETLKKSFVHPPGCYFFGSFWLTLATMILNMQRYALPHTTGDWMIVTIRVLFWLYAGMTLLSASIHMVMIWKFVRISAVEFPAAAFILILNVMLTGTVAGDISLDQPPNQRLPIMVAGVAYQGLGWIMCMFFLTFTIGNLLEKGWPVANLRTGLFIMVGTSGFTIVALIGVARAAPMGYGYFATHPTAGEVVMILATWVGVFLWLFTFFVFLLAFMITMATVFRKEDGKWKLGLSWHNSAWGKPEFVGCVLLKLTFS